MQYHFLCPHRQTCLIGYFQGYCFWLAIWTDWFPWASQTWEVLTAPCCFLSRCSNLTISHWWGFSTASVWSVVCSCQHSPLCLWKLADSMSCWLALSNQCVTTERPTQQPNCALILLHKYTPVKRLYNREWVEIANTGLLATFVSISAVLLCVHVQKWWTVASLWLKKGGTSVSLSTFHPVVPLEMMKYTASHFQKGLRLCFLHLTTHKQDWWTFFYNCL